MQYKRLMGIDYGDRRIGIAFTDLLQMLSNPHSIYQSVDMETDVEYISNLAKQNDVEKIIVGLPLCMDGSENERTQITKLYIMIYLIFHFKNIGRTDVLLLSNLFAEIVSIS